MRWPTRVEPRTQCRGHRGTVPEMVAPADERILEVDAPVVDIDQRRQQIGDGRKVSSQQLGGGLRQFAPDPAQLTGGAAQCELGLLGGQEVSVYRVIGVDTDAAVDVHDGVRHPVSGVRRPERGGGHFGVGGQVLG